MKIWKAAGQMTQQQQGYRDISFFIYYSLLIVYDSNKKDKGCYLTCQIHTNVELEVQLYPYSISALEGGEWSSRPVRFSPGNENHYPLHRRLVGSRGRCAWIRKPRP